MITIIGTCHVFDLKSRVKDIIVKIGPDAVGVELDQRRFEGLTQKGMPSFNILALIQQAIARRYGVEVGNDMLGGVEGATDLGIPLVWIDMDLEQTKRKLKEVFSREFLNPIEILRKILAGINISLSRPRPKISGSDWVEVLIDQFEKDPEKYRSDFVALFPYFKRIILDEREEYMGDRIMNMAEGYGDVVAVVGAGHLSGLKKVLSGLDVHYISLKELRKS